MPKLPILMYHGVSTKASESKNLTISTENLEAQFRYLKENGYTSLHFRKLQNMKSTTDFPEKAVIITFDDVYVNQLELAYPLLQKYGLKASFFIPFKYVNGVDEWNTGNEKLMSVAQLKSMDEATIELGLHSFSHKKYHELSTEEIDEDFEKCKEFIVSNQLNVSNILAYPYGKYPRKNPEKDVFFNSLLKHKVAFGLRIGNRVNTFPFKDNYEVQRIDIKGEDSLSKFKSKLRYGKSRFFLF
ncbi:Poly-beta-1,6-N-acetyl-D-glucosamine N-deacetylase [Kordia antarctica]|uniref:Poly-beta-1,6-N-acetyl-D-glucosamine N-deacetylase n=1 Tax=Kordia antarctica TaxID=1218801 RepID=A0A7L4ZR56_9FLAO|nr:polysaccharide deacetylase family protein [Kordia antarctica]QHI38969.1 Poly-beta-1,6-N-acetyl-D-glucosamine N-deacetylase [Kordia antarctica]